MHKMKNGVLLMLLAIMAVVALVGYSCEGENGPIVVSNDPSSNNDNLSDNQNNNTNTGNPISVDHPAPIQGGQEGWASRYWDCCKPHCGWTDNVPSGVSPVGTCSELNIPNGASDQIKSSCDGGEGYQCWNMAPYQVSDRLAYGYAAVPGGGENVCGKCYQLDFTGESHNTGNNDEGTKRLKGKTMIVQAINIGWDVKSRQFDLLIPGGGVGNFDACSKQWNAHGKLGEQYGGFLFSCRKQYNTYGEYKSCVENKCNEIFRDNSQMHDLMAGCQWFVEWFAAADNPKLKYKEVSCPEEIMNLSGMRP